MDRRVRRADLRPVALPRQARRRRHDPAPDPRQHRLEIAWTIIPVVLVVLVAVPTVRTIFATEQRVTPRPRRHSSSRHGLPVVVQVRVPRARHHHRQRADHPGRLKRVVVDLDSADVLHAFWVPNLAGKRDMIPNQDNQIWFVADRPASTSASAPSSAWGRTPTCASA
jgi:cytochrome c oxidase subunit II